MRIKTIIILLFMALGISAADQFVTFAEQAGAVPLRGATIVCSDHESKAVQIAAASLQQDFQRVMGFTPALSLLPSDAASAIPTIHSHTQSTPLVFIATVGCNKQIDQWVKSGQLPDLKGKRE